MLKKKTLNSNNVRILYICCFAVVSFLMVNVFFLSQRKEKGLVEPYITRAIVLPHHDILIDKFPTFYSYLPLKDKEKVKRIIFIAPNHFEPNEGRVKTKVQDYILSQYEKVPIDIEFVERMKQANLVDIDEHVFINEHAVNLHLPSVFKNYPTAKFIPMLMTRNVKTPSLFSMIDFLSENTSVEDTLFIVSTDFSHNLTYQEAEKRDEEMMSLIKTKNFERIKELNDEYTDCPECLYVLFYVLDKKESVKPTILFHGNSRDFIDVPESAPTTSYFVISM